jgi:hypothetical protein
MRGKIPGMESLQQSSRAFPWLTHASIQSAPRSVAGMDGNFQRGRLQQLWEHLQPVASTRSSYSSGLRVNFAAIKLLDLDSSPEQRLHSGADAREQFDNHQSFLLCCRHRENVNQARIKRLQMSLWVRSLWLCRLTDRQCLLEPVHQRSEFWGKLAAVRT